MATKITFTRPYTVKAAGGETYDEGQTVELSAESAAHFLSRRVAVPAGKYRPKSHAEGSSSDERASGEGGGSPTNADDVPPAAALLALEVPEAAAKELAAAGVETADGLAAWAADNDLTGLPEVGKATARKILAAVKQAAGETEPTDQTSD